MADALDRLKQALQDRYSIERELGADGIEPLAEEDRLWPGCVCRVYVDQEVA